MKPRSYTQAIAHLLQPLGYVRQGNDWILRAGDIEECVNLQNSWLGRGVTVNLYSVDLRSKALLNEALSPAEEWQRWWINVRIGHLFSEFDKWWKKDPHGPADVAEKVRDYGLPYLIRMRDPIAQANYFGLQTLLHGKWKQGAGVGHLAVTLHRMGEHDLACRALDVPRRRHEIPLVIQEVKALRTYLGCPPTVNWPADGSMGPIAPAG